MSGRHDLPPVNRLRAYFAILLAVIWAMSYVVAVASNNYTGLTLLTPLMLVAAGYLLTGRKNGNGTT